MLQELREGAARLLSSDYQAVKPAVRAVEPPLTSFSSRTHGIKLRRSENKLSRCGRLRFPRWPAFL